jgi:hypothetical protein
MVFKNLIYELKMMNVFTQFTNMVHTSSSLCYQKDCSHSLVPWISLKLVYARTMDPLNGCKKTFFFPFLVITNLAFHCFIWSSVFSKCVIGLRWVWEARAPFQTLITYILFSYFVGREISKSWFGVFLCSGIGLMQMAIREWSNTCFREFEIFVLSFCI